MGHIDTLIVMIPCHNEADNLPAVLADLPRNLPGVGRVAVLVVDDHSTDDTVAIAKAHGAEHVLSLKTGQPSLAQAFLAGVHEARRLGASAMVNTDGDHQYLGEGIPKLVAGLQAGAWLCVGVRGGQGRASWPWWKVHLHRVAAWGMGLLSAAPAPDPNSGFRAWSAEALARVNVTNTHSYVLETLLQANLNGWPVAWVDTPTQAPKRPSRLIRSVSGYVRKSATVALKSTWRWRPWRLAAPFALAFLGLSLAGVALWAQGGSGLRPDFGLGLAYAAGSAALMSVAVGLLASQEAWRLKVAEEALSRVRQQQDVGGLPLHRGASATESLDVAPAELGNCQA